MKKADYDVVVVGGGPAGLATSIRTQTAGLRTIVLDRRAPAIDQACGEGIMPDGVACLKALGVTIPADARRPFRGIRYIDGDRIAQARFPDEPGLGIRRLDLHTSLAIRALEVGVELGWRTPVLGLNPGEVNTRDGAISARFVIGADGRGSRVRSWAGLSTPPSAPERFGVRRHYAIEPWSDSVEVHWAENCEAYVTPVGNRLTGIALLWRRRKASFDQLLSLFPTLEHRLRTAVPASKDRGAALITQRPKTVVKGNLALVGDASGALDPITGEGLTVAFRQAHALADAIAANDLQPYAIAHRRLSRKPRALTGLVLFAERHPGLRRRLVGAFASDPGLFQRFLKIAVTDAPVTSIGLTGVFRLFKGLAVA